MNDFTKPMSLLGQAMMTGEMPMGGPMDLPGRVSSGDMVGPEMPGMSDYLKADRRADNLANMWMDSTQNYQGWGDAVAGLGAAYMAGKERDKAKGLYDQLGMDKETA